MNVRRSSSTEVTRRDALTALGAVGLVGTLTGCGLRLDTPPPPPPVPTRKRVDDEDLLLTMWTSLDGLARSAAAVGKGQDGTDVDRANAARIGKLHAAQARVVRGRMTNEGVPTTLMTSTAPTAPRVADLARAEAAQAGKDRLAAIAGATSQRPLLVSVTTMCRAAASVLGGDEPEVVGGASAGAAQAVANLLGKAAYGMDVVAAQAGAEDAKTARGTRADVRTLVSEVSAAYPTTTPRGAAYALPFPVTDGEAARRLAVHLLTTGRDAALASVPAAATGEDLALLTAVAARLMTMARDWDERLLAFPGMKES